MDNSAISGQRSQVFLGTARMQSSNEDAAPSLPTGVDARVGPVANDSLQGSSELQAPGDPNPGRGWSRVGKPQAQVRAPHQKGLGTRRGVQIGRSNLGLTPGRQRVRGGNQLNPETYVPKQPINAGKSGFTVPARAISSQELAAKAKAALASRKPVRADTEIQKNHKQRVKNLEQQFKALGAQRGQSTIELGTLGNNANPVTRMHEQSMIPASKFPTEFRPTPKNVKQGEDILQKAFVRASGKTPALKGKGILSQSFDNLVRGKKTGQRHRIFGGLKTNASPQEIKGAFEEKKGQVLPQNIPGVGKHAIKVIQKNVNNIDWSQIQTVEEAEQALSDAYTLTEQSYGVEDDFDRQTMQNDQRAIERVKPNLLNETVVTGQIHHLEDGLDESASPEEFTAHFHDKLNDLQGMTAINLRRLQRSRNQSADDKAEIQALENLRDELALLTPDAVQPTPHFSKQAVVDHLRETNQADTADALSAVDGEYLTSAQLEEAGIENPQQLAENAGIEGQYSLLESLEMVKGNPHLEKLVLGTVDLSANPGFAFKAQGGIDGAENFNELRFQEHLSINGGNQLLRPKLSYRWTASPSSPAKANTTRIQKASCPTSWKAPKQ